MHRTGGSFGLHRILEEGIAEKEMEKGKREKGKEGKKGKDEQ